METQVQNQAEDVFFDTSSGISLEEQQEILAGINAMAGGSRLSGEDTETEARKKGFLFPLFVNISALVFLGLGFALLFFLHGQEELGIRESSATLGLTERKLIQEIRRETNRQLGEKEKEINDILSKLSATDAEFRDLQGSMESLSVEQKERAAALLVLQEEYRHTLSGLEDEKTKIMEDSRLKESALRSRAEERVRELSSRAELSEASLGAAMEELGRLGNEQERAGRAESQMSGFFRTVNNQIGTGRLDEASLTLEAMKDFLNSPLFQGVRTLETRKQTHLAAINAMEEAIAEVRSLKDTAGLSAVVMQIPADSGQDEALSALEIRYSELSARYAVLDQKVSDQDKALSALSSQGSDQDRLIAGYVSEINSLNAANINQQQTLNRRDNEIVGLRAENDSMGQQIIAFNTNITALNAQLLAANNRASDNETALEEQMKEYSDLLEQKEELQSQYDDLQRRMDAAVRAFTGE